MKTTLTHFDRLMAAITFAEANEPELAREFITDTRKPDGSAQAPAAKTAGGHGVKNQTTH